MNATNFKLKVDTEEIRSRRVTHLLNVSKKEWKEYWDRGSTNLTGLIINHR